MTSTKWWPSYERQELRSKTRNRIPTLGALLVCMILREIPSNCGNLHNSAPSATGVRDLRCSVVLPLRRGLREPSAHLDRWVLPSETAATPRRHRSNSACGTMHTQACCE